MRSKLFVPGARPELFAKALAGDADAIAFDLEDSVAEGRKAEARAAVMAFLRSPAAMASTKTLVVRVNAVDTPHFSADVSAVVQAAVALINLPKPRSAADVRTAAAAIEAAAAANGVGRPLAILANIETPRALRCAAEIAAAHPRVAGLQLGLADLFEPLGIDAQDGANRHAAMFAVRMAAGEAGVYACDAAFTDIRDADGFRQAALTAKRLGYIGKTCIHPSQVATANEVFRPSDEEIAFSLRVLAARDAEASGKGAFAVDGRMVDAPFIRRAEAIVAVARSMGQVADG